MAKSTAEERRLRRVGLAERSEQLRDARRLDADYAERAGDTARAAVFREAADRHAAMARQHRQEAARLGQRARARQYRTDPTEKARQALAAISSAPAPASDCLDRQAEIAAEIKAIWEQVDRLEQRRNALPLVGAEVKRAGLQGKMHGLILRIAEWEREAARSAQASPQKFEPSGNSGELADHADSRKNAN